VNSGAPEGLAVPAQLVELGHVVYNKTTIYLFSLFPLSVFVSYDRFNRVHHQFAGVNPDTEYNPKYFM
jgi:hypothetical protein